MTVIVNTSNTAANWSDQSVDVLLPGCEITSIYQAAATTNNSAAAVTLLRNRTGSSHEYVICGFDVAAIIAAIPAGEVVKNAYLRLHVNTNSGDFNDEYGVDHLARPVVFSETTWNEFSAGNAWESAGALGAADITSEDIAVVAYNPQSAPSPWMEWDIAAFVKSVIGGAVSNSVIVRRLNTIDTDSYVSISLDNQSGSDGVRPELVVVTGAPEATVFNGTINDVTLPQNGAAGLDIAAYFSGDINGFSLSGAPVGSSISPTGMIIWDQSVPGVYSVTVTATGTGSADSNEFSVYIAPPVAINVDNATPAVGATVTIVSNTPVSGATVFGQSVQITHTTGNNYTFEVPRPQDLSIDYGYSVTVEASDDFTTGSAQIQITPNSADFYFLVDISGGVPVGSIFSAAQNIASGQKCYAKVITGSVQSFDSNGVAVGIAVSGQETAVSISYDIFEPLTYTWVTGGLYNVPLVAGAEDTERPVISISGGTQQINIGEQFVYPEASVTDNSGANLDDMIEVTGTVDNTTAGEYTITFSGPVDAAGNVADSVQFICTVIDNTAPTVFQIAGESLIVDQTGSPLTHTFDHWFVTDSNIEQANKAGEALAIVASGENFVVTDGEGILSCVGPTAGQDYKVQAYSYAPGVSEPVEFVRMVLTAGVA